MTVCVRHAGTRAPLTLSGQEAGLRCLGAGLEGAQGVFGGRAYMLTISAMATASHTYLCRHVSNCTTYTGQFLYSPRPQ